MRKTLSALIALLFLVAAAPAQTTPIVKTQTVRLIVSSAPDFNMDVTPAMITTYVGRTVAYSATFESVNDFAGDITLIVAGLPAEVTVTFSPSATVTIAPGAIKAIQINVEIPAAAALVGDYLVGVTATSDKYN